IFWSTSFASSTHPIRRSTPCSVITIPSTNSRHRPVAAARSSRRRCFAVRFCRYLRRTGHANRQSATTACRRQWRMTSPGAPTWTMSAARKLPAGELRFLFNGVDWKRKGGAIAVSTIAELTRRGIPARLDVIGRTDAVMRGAPTPANVTFHGFIAKTTETGASKFNRLYADATFFLLPTQAECFGISFAEAAHHGLPCIGTATGGVPAA